MEDAEDNIVARLVIVDNRLLPLVLNGRFIVAIDDEITNEDTAFLVTDYICSGSTVSLLALIAWLLVDHSRSFVVNIFLLPTTLSGESGIG